MTESLKGGAFQNRYLIKATLIATAPFHIGSGEITERSGMIDDKKKPIQISAVVTDADNKAYIPGSSLRGAIREWLMVSFKDMKEELLNTPAVKQEVKNIKESSDEKKIKDENLLKLIQKNATALERLFGSQYNEGKLEVWAACCTSSVITKSDDWLSGWDKDRLTYVAKSVAIDPTTGTAAENKLYNFELVPEGATFTATFSAQNLNTGEPELLMAILNGFNDKQNPIMLGSMTNRSFGSFEISGFQLYRMDSSEGHRKKWCALAMSGNKAGYDILEDDFFKVTITPKTVELQPVKHKETWDFTLETPLVIRSGGKFGWENAPRNKKNRNHNMRYRWGKDRDDLDEIGDLNFSLKIVGDKVEPYYHVPSSSIRGPLREWAITHLLPKDLWDVEKHLKSLESISGINNNLQNILDLFGFAVDSKKPEITERFTRAGRLAIRVQPFTENEIRPMVDGTWNNQANDNNFGPKNAKRHIKPRNPLDRISHEAKKGALHNSLEFSQGQKLSVTIEINAPTDFDKELLHRWKEEINNGMIPFGGLTGIGRGRMSFPVSEDNAEGRNHVA